MMNDKANATTPANGTPSELESEFRDGIPSAVETHPVECLCSTCAGFGHAVYETVSDYFKRLYPEYYVQIITNMNRERGPSVTASVLISKAQSRELHCAFIWSDSPEGHAFWEAVAQREAL
jgi:hypothetical protein